MVQGNGDSDEESVGETCAMAADPRDVPVPTSLPQEDAASEDAESEGPPELTEGFSSDGEGGPYDDTRSLTVTYVDDVGTMTFMDDAGDTRHVYAGLYDGVWVRADGIWSQFGAVAPAAGTQVLDDSLDTRRSTGGGAVRGVSSPEDMDAPKNRGPTDFRGAGDNGQILGNVPSDCETGCRCGKCGKRFLDSIDVPDLARERDPDDGPDDPTARRLGARALGSELPHRACPATEECGSAGTSEEQGKDFIVDSGCMAHCSGQSENELKGFVSRSESISLGNAEHRVESFG
jgi:hypothetical protein